MFGIGETEFVIILIFGFLLFGPDKLPGIGRTIGRVLRQFREASEGFTEVVQTNVIDPATQELNNTGSNKRTPSAAKAQAAQAQDPDDEDADIEGDGESATPKTAPKRETFAERKARLEAERAAREAAVAEQGLADDEDADAPVTGDPTPTATQAGPAKPKAEVAAAPSVADLYSRGSRRSSRAQAEDAVVAPQPDPAGHAVTEGSAPIGEDAPTSEAAATSAEDDRDSTEGEGGQPNA